MRSDLANKAAVWLSVAAAIFLIGVVYVGATSEDTPGDVNYTLDLEARTIGDVAEVYGKTNLPNGSRLEVAVDRLYRLEGRGIWHAARVGEAQAVVNDNRWHADVSIDDVRWIDDLDQRLETGQLDPIEAILPELRATVIFTPLVEQSNGIQREMGTNFERLSNSVLAVEEGDHWVLRRQKDFEKPLSAQLQSRLIPARAAGS